MTDVWSDFVANAEQAEKLRQLADEPADLLYIPRVNLKALLVEKGFLPGFIYKLYDRLDNWQAVQAYLRTTNEETEALENYFASPSALAAANDPIKPENIRLSKWHRILHSVVIFESNPWPAFFETVRPYTDSLCLSTMDALSSLASRPINLVYAPIDTMRNEFEKACVTALLVECIFDSLDTWPGIASSITLTDQQAVDLRKFYTTPHDMAIALANRESLQWPQSVDTALQQRILQILCIYDGPFEPRKVAKRCLKPRGNPVPAPQFQGLANVTKNTSISEVGVTDHELALALHSKSFASLLNKCSARSIRVLHLQNSFISSLEVLAEQIETTCLCLVDVSWNRIEVDQFENMQKVAKTMYERKGALVVHGNAVVSPSDDCVQENLQKWAAAESLGTLLHTMWISPNWVCARAWEYAFYDSACTVSRSVLDAIEQAHVSFYRLQKNL